MVITSPVCGLRPERSALSLTSKVPKSTKAMESPTFKVASMVLVKPSNARPASALIKLACSAMVVISSDLLMAVFLKVVDKNNLRLCFRGSSTQASNRGKSLLQIFVVFVSF